MIRTVLNFFRSLLANGFRIWMKSVRDEERSEGQIYLSNHFFDLRVQLFGVVLHGHFLSFGDWKREGNNQAMKKNHNSIPTFDERVFHFPTPPRQTSEDERCVNRFNLQTRSDWQQARPCLGSYTSIRYVIFGNDSSTRLLW